MSAYFRQLRIPEPSLSPRKYECLRRDETRLTRQKFTFKQHQQHVIDHCRKVAGQSDSNYRGILLYHTLGLGKTCTSIGIANALLSDRNRQFTRVAVILPAALRLNYVKEYCTKCGGIHMERFRNQFDFYAYNDSGVTNRLPNRFRDTVIIIDEVHNLLAGRRNASKTKSYVYEVIKNSENSFVVALSGTPLYGSTRELPYLLKLLKHKTPLPTNNRDWIELLYQDLMRENPLDTEIFKASQNVLSFIEPTSIPELTANYPGVERDVYVMCKLTNLQKTAYDKAVEFENNILAKKFGKDTEINDDFIMTHLAKLDEAPSEDKGPIEYLAMTRFFSRRASVAVYPEKKQQLIGIPLYLREQFPRLEELVDLIYGLDLFNPVIPGGYAALKLSELIPEKAKRFQCEDRLKMCDSVNFKLDRNIFDGDPTPALWDQELCGLNYYQLHQMQTRSCIKMLQLDQLRTTYSPKLAAVYDRIQRYNGKHVIYCQFKMTYGVYLISAILDYQGISYRSYTGDDDEATREGILEEFNGQDNINGEKYQVLIVTDAGVEGLSIMATRYIHILSPQIIQNKINQVIGRIRRLGSHIAFPPDQRKITVFRYLGILNPALDGQEIDAVDAMSTNFDSEIDLPFKNINPQTRKLIDDTLAQGGDVRSIMATIPSPSIDQSVTLSALNRDQTIGRVLHLMRLASIESLGAEDLSQAPASQLIEDEPDDEPDVDSLDWRQSVTDKLTRLIHNGQLDQEAVRSFVEPDAFSKGQMEALKTAKQQVLKTIRRLVPDKLFDIVAKRQATRRELLKLALESDTDASGS